MDLNSEINGVDAYMVDGIINYLARFSGRKGVTQDALPDKSS